MAGKAGDSAIGTEVDQVVANHKLMAGLLAMALACYQTNVLNRVFSHSVSSLRRPGDSMIRHQRTHEEPIDEMLGYQPIATGFVERSMQGWATLLSILAGIREGDGTLLNNCLLFARSDTRVGPTLRQMTGVSLDTWGQRLDADCRADLRNPGLTIG